MKNLEKIFWIFLLILSLETFSYSGFIWPFLREAVFFILIVSLLILSLVKLEYGFYFVLAELLVGSKGYLFYFEKAGISISIRLAFFLIILGVWFFRVLQGRIKLGFLKNKFSIFANDLRIFLKNSIRSLSTPPPFLTKKVLSITSQNHSNFLLKIQRLSKNGGGVKILLRKFQRNFTKNLYFLFSIFLIWGVIQGFLSKNRFDNLFFDANGWLYFGLLPLFLSVIKSERVIENIFDIFLAVLFWLFLKTTVLFYLFSHPFEFIQPGLYQWVKLTGIGEITKTGFGFSRIFFQSQIYFLVGFFLILASAHLGSRLVARKHAIKFPTEKFALPLGLAPSLRSDHGRSACATVFLANQPAASVRLGFWVLLFLTTFPLLVSFSRSFWFGILAGLIIFLIIAKLKIVSWGRLGQIILSLLIVLIFNFIFLIFILALPPEGIFLKDLSMISQRFSLAEEPAALSRWEQLGPLFEKIKIRPIFGSGFGTTITYHSFDPRAIEKYKGQYTTYAFEWGYLDIWLKIGLMGLLVYLLLIWQIIKSGWQMSKLKINPAPEPQSTINWLRDRQVRYGARNEKLKIGLIFGLIAILFVNVFSPYLNHPLGIGYLMLASAIFNLKI